ncbi:hypothetical protein ACJX0J_018239, partial [Zea mays]
IILLIEKIQAQLRQKQKTKQIEMFLPIASDDLQVHAVRINTPNVLPNLYVCARNPEYLLNRERERERERERAKRGFGVSLDTTMIPFIWSFNYMNFR